MTARITRRQFVLGAGVSAGALLAGCGRLPWQAQPVPKVYRVGFLSLASAAIAGSTVEDFRQGMRD